MELSRRRIATYARSNRRTLVHDLFNVAQKEPCLYETLLPPATKNAASSGASTPGSEMSEDPEASQQLRRELSIFADASSHLTRGLSPPSNSTTPARAPSPSLFDLESSGDDTKTKSKAESTKRRKLAPKSSNVRIDKAATTMTGSSPPSPAPQPPTIMSPKKRGAGNTKPKSRSDKTKIAPSGLKPTAPEGSELNELDFLSERTSLNSSQNTPPDLGSPRSEKSASSMASRRSTPKRKRQKEEDLASDLSSPSQLELSSLRLTPNRRSRAPADSEDPTEREKQSRTPSKVRGRLVDRLDSRSEAASLEIDMLDASPRPRKSRKLLTSQKNDLPDDQVAATRESSSNPQLQRSEGGRTDASAPRIRTYGKKRTHLQDNVPGPDRPGHTSSQQSLQDIVFQVDALTAPKSQFEIEDDTDDEDPAPKVKSIHELRHAGVANRFDRDLDMLLEDAQSGSKSLRIQALMSFVRKLQDKTFKAHVLVSGKLGRLVEIATPELDSSSSVVLILALWALAVADTATTHAMSQIYECLIQFPPTLLAEERAVATIAKDRKENLSKGLAKDLADFEQHVLDKSIKQEGQAGHIIISRVFLRCLELTLKRIIVLAGRAKDPPVPVFEGVLECLKHNLEEIRNHGERPELVESIRLLLAWLELTAATSTNIGHIMPPLFLEDLGTSLSEVIKWSKLQHPMIEQSSIKFAVELSKGNSAVCSRFASTPLLPAIFNVVEEHFSRLTVDGGEDPIEIDKLNSVILALGCLLHSAECSDEVRTKMSMMDGATESLVNQLVNIFNVFVDEVGEAITEERTQALDVPFGWLCLLLCTFCLDAPTRRHISSTIQGDGLTRLLTQAEICFNIMKSVDEDSFVERFGNTLEAVKHDVTL